jgi:hypothetical protein
VSLSVKKHWEKENQIEYKKLGKWLC